MGCRDARSNVTRLKLAVALVAVGASVAGCADGGNSAEHPFIEIIAADSSGIDTSGFLLPLSVDPDAEFESLFEIHFSEVIAWEEDSFVVTARLSERLADLKSDHPLERLVFRLTIDGSVYWGWVWFHIEASLPQTSTLLVAELRDQPELVHLESWGTNTAEGVKLSDAARRAWSSTIGQ